MISETILSEEIEFNGETVMLSHLTAAILNQDNLDLQSLHNRDKVTLCDALIFDADQNLKHQKIDHYQLADSLLYIQKEFGLPFLAYVWETGKSEPFFAGAQKDILESAHGVNNYLSEFVSGV